MNADSRSDVSAGTLRRRVDSLIADTRTLLASHGVSRESLARVRERLQQLAGERALFSAERFPSVPAGTGRLYTLHEDADGSFALYVNVCGPQVRSPAHDHSTWAVIAGIEGEEFNTFYSVDPAAGDVAVRVTGEKTIGPGDAIALMPQDVHSIDTRDQPRVACLHFYGRGLPQQTDRRAFPAADADPGAQPAKYAPQPEIVRWNG